jgi:glutamine synthetase
MTKAELVRRVKADKVDYLLAQFADIYGAAKCKGVPATHLEDLLASGAGFAGAALWGFGQGPHDHDMIAIPDIDSYTPVPWEAGVARFACDITVDGQPWAYCSRTALKRALADLREAGYVLNVGVEAEHFLVTRRPDGSIARFDPDGVDTLEKPCYDFKGISGSMAYLRTLIGYLQQLGWDPYASDHEDGNAQWEINWRYSDALTTADRYTFYKMMTSQVAKRFGAVATHMAKPFAGLTGSGAHFHFSLWDAANRRNLFLDERDRHKLGQSRLAYQFLGGLLEHAKALCGLMAPTVNCYKRLSVGTYLTGVASGFTWTPAFITYGDNNRTQMFRTPEPGRFECRAISAGCNPYLALAGFVRAGMDGIKRKLDPGEPTLGNLYEMSLETMRQKGIEVLPQSLPEALDHFEKDPVVRSALGEEFAREFVNVKRQEWVRYHNTVSAWELDNYLTRF